MVAYLLVVSDFLVNISAGFIGVAIVLPLYARSKRKKLSYLNLLLNVTCGILTLVLAAELRRHL